MEEYEEMENGAPNALDAPDAFAVTTPTPQGEDYEELSQSGQMVPWMGAKSEINGMGSRGILKATSGNTTKKFKICAITRAGKSAQAIIMKQIATEERQAEKRLMKEWKRKIMEEVACELQIIREMYQGAMETQRQSFQLQYLELELEALRILGQ